MKKRVDFIVTVPFKICAFMSLSDYNIGITRMIIAPLMPTINLCQRDLFSQEIPRDIS